jgi:hypothetical protein
MLCLYIVIGLFIVSTLTSILVSKYGDWDFEWLEILGGVFSVFSGVTMAVLIASLVNIDRKFDTFVNRYNFTKELVVNYEPNDYGNKTALLDDVISINKKIAEHKAYAGNVWSGAWYSEKIAELEPIVFTGKSPTVKIEKTE